ncbi:MAG: hypothetical protein JWN66_4525 [Sphingomonas bacterium]|uniref:hypothetical protein n=1 Tax=Sphingomonas bacterium TaxID=1895847 RepID=UPI002608F83F|nr:hypothetical protein [Sphingomonas bacterium]MDB5707409.1 hypothetical protein [Sphingomonas bacterium]
MMRMVFGVASAFFLSTSAMAQQVSLPSDTEYRGILLATGAARLYPNGRVSEAVLKEDYQAGFFTLQGGTAITFDSVGNIAVGTLKTPVTIGKLTYGPGRIAFNASGIVTSAALKTGSEDFNLRIPVDGTALFDGNGRVSTFTPITGAPYRLLGKTVMQQITVAFNDVTRSYWLYQGQAGLPQLVARVTPKYSTSGLPMEAAPVILPAAAQFSCSVAEQSIAPDFSCLWTLTSFKLNGVDFGPTPQVTVRDMRVVSVLIYRDLTIGGVAYKSGQKIILDDSGRPIPPSL